MVNLKELFKRKPDERLDALYQKVNDLEIELNKIKIENERMREDLKDLKQVKTDDNAVSAQDVMDEYFRGAKGDYR